MAPRNSISMIKSEIALSLTAMKWDTRIPSRSANDEAHKSLFKGLNQLRTIMNKISDLDEIEPLVYLTPFLNIVKSETTSGYITDLALTSIDKFLSYGLLEPPNGGNATGPGSMRAIASAADAIANAVTKTKFAGSNRHSDEVVLMKILHVLRTLLLLPAGFFITNDSVGKILEICFQLCFETKVSELLRKTSETMLSSIIQLFFSRLSTLNIELEPVDSVATFPTSQQPAVRAIEEVADSAPGTNSELRKSPTSGDEDAVIVEPADYLPEDGSSTVEEASLAHAYLSKDEFNREPVVMRDQQTFQPYGLLAIYRLLDYLISCLDTEKNSDNILLTALNLLTVAMETGADAASHCEPLMHMVRSRLCKHLILLLNTDRASTLTSTCRLAFLLFESMRTQLKLQLEVYLERLIELVSSDNARFPVDLKEIGLDALIQIFSLPCFPVEMYVNYDCDAYAVSLFELVAETLAKNAYTTPGPTGKQANTLQLLPEGYSTISIDALLNVMDSVEASCMAREKSTNPEQTPAILIVTGMDMLDPMLTSGRPPPRNRHCSHDSRNVPTSTDLEQQRTRKRVLHKGTQKFNTSPKTGISYLQKYKILPDPLDPDQMAQFLVENPALDKKVTGDYLSNRKNADVLAKFVTKLNFSGMRIDKALRVFLEAFRLPGEAPLIQHLMEHFAEQWSIANENPFANVDAAFTLSYAILMLNTDQHNPNSKKQNIPMNLQAFRRNLKGMNGGDDFTPELLEEIFKEIRDNEIVMPSEQAGLVRENYLWKCLLNRCKTGSVTPFMHVPVGLFDAEIFAVVCGPLLNALLKVFERAPAQDAFTQLKAISGLVQCARLASYYGMSSVLDMLIMEMCKFTGLLPGGHHNQQTTKSAISSQDGSADYIAPAFGRNSKARLAASLAFSLAAHHADQLRDGWRSLIECVLQLFRANILPRELVETEDYTQVNRIVKITPKGPSRNSGSSKTQQDTQNKSETGVLSSFYQYFYSSNSSQQTNAAHAQQSSILNSDTSSARDAHSSDEAKHGLTAKQLAIQINVKNALANAVIDSVTQVSTSLNETLARQTAVKAAGDLHIVQLMADTKFLSDASLDELIQALLSYIYDIQNSLCNSIVRERLEQHLDALWHSFTASSQQSSADSSISHGVLHSLEFYQMLMQDAISTHCDSNEATEQQREQRKSNLAQMPLSASAPTLNQMDDSAVAKPNTQDDNSLAKTLLDNKKSPVSRKELASALPINTECRVFCLELLTSVLLTNRDRVAMIWPKVRIRLAEIMLCSDTPSFLIERVCVGLIRLAKRMLRKQEMTLQILLFLHGLLVLRAPQLLIPADSILHPYQQRRRLHQRIHQAQTQKNRETSAAEKQALTMAIRYLRSMSAVHETCLAQQIVRGLGDLMHSHAADLSSPLDWHLVFSLLSVSGASLRIVPTKQLLHISWRASADDESSGSAANALPLGDTAQHMSQPSTKTMHSSMCDLSMDQQESKETACYPLQGVVGSRHLAYAEKLSHSWVVISPLATSSCTVDTPPRPISDSDEVQQQQQTGSHVFSKFSIDQLALPVEIGLRDAQALEKACESLSFLIRDPAYLMPDNYESCVYCLRVFIEACLCTKADQQMQHKLMADLILLQQQQKSAAAAVVSSGLANSAERSPSPGPSASSSNASPTMGATSAPGSPHHSQQSTLLLNSFLLPEGGIEELRTNVMLEEQKRLNPITQTVALQLLDLIHTMFMRTTSIYNEWNRQQGSHHGPDAELLWNRCWLPLLKATARLAIDVRKEIRTDALAYLQRELLSPILQPLSGKHWLLCFEQVLFPLLSAYLESIAHDEAATSKQKMAELNDPRMRAIPIITKVFLQHLTPLHALPNFVQLWSHLLCFMEHFITASSSDSLTDAVRESLKNVLLVMYTSSILVRDAQAQSHERVLWDATVKQLSNFLPDMLDQLFPPPVVTMSSSPVKPSQVVAPTVIQMPDEAELMERGESPRGRSPVDQAYHQPEMAPIVYPVPSDDAVLPQYTQPVYNLPHHYNPGYAQQPTGAYGAYQPPQHFFDPSIMYALPVHHQGVGPVQQHQPEATPAGPQTEVKHIPTETS